MPFHRPLSAIWRQKAAYTMGMSSGAVYTYMHIRISVLAVDAISSICGGDGLFPLFVRIASA